MTKTPQKQHLLITGAAGRLGPLMRAAFADWQGPPIGVIQTSRHAGADLILDPNAPLPDLPRADVVLGLWGSTANDPSAIAINTRLAGATRDVARASGARLALHLSSAAVYGPGMSMGETHPPDPQSDYARSKLAMEQVVAGFNDPDLHHCCLRLANVVGADSLAPALSGDAPVTLDRFADGHGPLRSYLTATDLARITVALAALPYAQLPDILNLAAPDPVAMADLARAAGRDIRWQDAPDTATQVVTLSTHRLSSLLPALTLHKTADQMITDWHRLTGTA